MEVALGRKCGIKVRICGFRRCADTNTTHDTGAPRKAASANLWPKQTSRKAVLKLDSIGTVATTEVSGPTRNRTEKLLIHTTFGFRHFGPDYKRNSKPV